MQSRMQGQRTLQLRQNSCIQPKWISQKNFTFGAATSAYQVYIYLRHDRFRGLISSYNIFHILSSLQYPTLCSIRLKVQHIEHLMDGTISLIDIQVINII